MANSNNQNADLKVFAPEFAKLVTPGVFILNPNGGQTAAVAVVTRIGEQGGPLTGIVL